MSQGQIIRAEVEGIGTLEFPAGTDPAVIQRTVKRVIAERQQMPQPQYLSTDPKAGDPAGGYLSTNPRDGEPVDYAKLAEQARKGTPAVDYAALAEQARRGPEAQDWFAANAPKKAAPGGDWFAANAVVRGAGHMVADAAPAVGGMVGGFVGGVPGAAVGGVAGHGIGNLIEHGAELPGAAWDVARNLFSEPAATMQGFAEGTTQGAVDTAKAGATQAVAQFAGNKIVQAGGVMAKWLMNRATSRVSERLIRDFPDLSDTLIDNALTVSKGGYEKAKLLLVGAKHKATAALHRAEANGAKIPIAMTDDIAESFKAALLEDAIKSKAIPQSAGAIMAASNRLPPSLRLLFLRINDAARRGTNLELTATQADVLKRRMQQESRALYANRGAPNGPQAMGMDATERAELATQINARIDAVAKGYRAANAEAQPLIGAVRGLKQAIRPTGNLYQAMLRPAVGAVMGEGVGRSQGLPSGVGAVTGALLTSPAGMSREAIILKDPKVQAMLRQLPRASAVALTELLARLSPHQPVGSAPQTGARR